MPKSMILLIFFAGGLLPVSVLSTDAQSIVDKVLELQDERREGVNRYVVEQKVMGQVSKVVFERTTVTGPDGEPVETFRMVLPDSHTRPDGETAVAPEDFENMAEDAVHAMAAFADKARLVGNESVDGKDTYHLVASDLNRVQEYSEGNSFTLQTINVWIDTDKYVPLKMTMDGLMDTDGTPRPMSMEKVDLDYREVPGSNMYESYKQIMHMNGVMSDETRQQVEQARESLEEFEQQLASMPQSQRDMMENMMGDQIEMMRKLAAGGGLEIVTEVVSITVE